MTSLESILEPLIERVVRRVMGEASDETGYLSTAQAAAFASVSQHTIRRWVRRGELTRHMAGSQLRVRRDELENLLRCEVVPIDSKLSPEERAKRRFG